MFEAETLARSALLSERIAWLRERRRQDGEAHSVTERGRRRAVAWREDFASRPELFDERLAEDGCTEDELLLLLSVQAAAPAAWQIPAYESVTTGESERALRRAGLAANGPAAPLGRLLALAQREVTAALQGLTVTTGSRPVSERDVDVLLATVPRQLEGMSARCVVLDLHVARLEGSLEGDSPEERHDRYLARFSDGGFTAQFFHRYPVLLRRLWEGLERWRDTVIEFAGRYAADVDLIRGRLFRSSDPIGWPDGIEVRLGDPHAGNRSVWLLSYGDGRRLIYKPRPLAVSCHLRELVAEINRSGRPPELWLPQVVDRGGYGWVEYVASRPCSSVAEVAIFYRRVGAWLCLLHLLGGTDMHHENVVSAGPHPVPIDLETLFVSPLAENLASEEALIDRLAGRRLQASVVAVGMLPQHVRIAEDGTGVDLSALGAVDEQFSSTEMPVWLEPGTDRMRMARTRSVLEPNQNAPRHQQSLVDPSDHAGDILEGHAQMWEWLAARREYLAAPGGRLESLFGGDTIRVVLRDTSSYGTLLVELTHPALLLDALDLERHFDGLYRAQLPPAWRHKLVRAEKRALYAGDIPLFQTRVTSTAILDAHGMPVGLCLERSGLEVAREKIARMDDAALRVERWLTETSLRTLRTRHIRQDDDSPYRAKEAVQPPCDASLLAMAETIAAGLRDLSVRDGKWLTWLQYRSIKGRSWIAQGAGGSLFEGLAGIALFFAQLRACTGNDDWLEIAERAAMTLREMIASVGRPDIGVFEGSLGMAYALTRLGRLWDDPALEREARRLTERAGQAVRTDDVLDVIGGSAGAIIFLSNRATRLGCELSRELAVACGRHLLDTMRATASGAVVWADSEEPPLTGYAHGASGFGLALARVFELTRTEEFAEAAGRALQYDTEHFSPEHGNWFDLRLIDSPAPSTAEQDHQRPAGAGFMLGWCSGAPGAGLARALMPAELRDDQWRKDLEQAIATTSGRWRGNQSLCHGSSGNLECLAMMRATFGSQADVDRVLTSMSVDLLASLRPEGAVVSGLPGGVDALGLMLGRAGVGYQLLRLAQPKQVPSVLALGL